MKEADPTQPKSPESEPARDIFLAYRENELYKEYGSKVAEMYRALGHVVETHVFPQGTELSEIAQWYTDKEETLAGKKLVADMTVLSQAQKKGRDIHSRKTSGRLDGMFADTAFKSIAQELLGTTSFEENIESVKMENAFKFLFEAAYKKGKPKKIFILEAKIDDHELFQRLSGYKEAQDQDIAGVSKKLSEVFESAGIPRESIEIISGSNSEQESRGYKKREVYGATEAQRLQMKDPDVWVVADRHASVDAFWPEATVITLPLSNLVRTLVEKGWINLPKEEFDRQLQTTVADSVAPSFF